MFVYLWAHRERVASATHAHLALEARSLGGVSMGCLVFLVCNCLLYRYTRKAYQLFQISTQRG